MKKILKYLLKEFILFLIGGFAYYMTEILYRGYSHYSMFILGGLCFCIIGELNQVYYWDMAFISQMFLSSIIITVLEFITGCIVNLLLNFHVWDYSHMPYNVLGQICLPFTVIWFFFSIIPIVLDDWIRYWFFGERKPKYKIF